VFPGLLADNTTVDLYHEMFSVGLGNVLSLNERFAEQRKLAIAGDVANPVEVSLVDWSRPADAAYAFGSLRWRKYLRGLIRKKNAAHRPHLIAFLCRAWNHEKRHRKRRLMSVKLFFVEMTNLPGYIVSKPKRRLVHSGPCPVISGSGEHKKK
jgi:hypothetical protein